MRVAALNRAMTPIAATRLALFTAAMSTAGAREIAGYKTTYEVVTEGKGAAVVSKGDSVTVHAKGTVAESQKKFWSTKDAGQQPFTYKAGVGGVITGWDQGCLGMKIGEVRKLGIPAHEGYGAPRLPGVGHPAQRRPAVRDRGALDRREDRAVRFSSAIAI